MAIVCLDWIQQSVPLLSVQKIALKLWFHISLSLNPASFAPIFVAANYSIGMLSCLVDATFVFLVTNCDVEDPSSLDVFRYTMVAIALIEA